MGNNNTDAEVRAFLGGLGRQEPEALPTRETITPETLKAIIEAEQAWAKADGKHWTNWRKFHCNEEATGIARCISQPRPSYCTQFAIYVSYSTGYPGRTVYCEGCFENKVLIPYQKQQQDKAAKVRES